MSSAASGEAVRWELAAVNVARNLRVRLRHLCWRGIGLLENV